MTSQTQTLVAYDQVPYLANPLPQTHPSRLAAIAAMFGVSYAPPKRARVLELGCASGVNLLGMAHFMAEAKFVGIDLSMAQIREAERRAKELNASNVVYHHMSIEDVDSKFGQFDYIICHGVYSWVPPRVQEAILRICRENLSDDGIAFVSYNVQPGWRMKQAARDVFMALTPPDVPAAQRWEYGVSWIKDALETTANDEKRPLLHQALDNELNSTLTQRDIRYLAHEYLEENNEPCLFRDFLAQVNKAELTYLGDVEPASMVRHIAHPSLREFFKRRPPQSMVETEQAIDIITGRSFRQSLLVRGKTQSQINRALTPDFFKKLHIQTRITRSEDKDGQVVYTHSKLGKITPNPPYGIHALDTLLAHANKPAVFKDLAEKFSELANGGNEGIFGDILFSLLGAGLVEIYADLSIPALPKGVTPLAVLDIKSGRESTSNYLGEMINLDPMQRFVVPLLQGDWDMSEAITKLAELYAKGQFTMNPAPTNDDQIKKILEQLVNNVVSTFKIHGIAG
ncbi:MAG: methyltransferase regulatory domain-containing protein [Holophagales bacterium]|nr:methyltransferase regulatory domain-containing protein [Holophagales bacterium]